jgi:hypothetical protein
LTNPKCSSNSSGGRHLQGGKGKDMFNWLQDSPLLAMIASLITVALFISPLEKQMAELAASVARLEARLGKAE